MGTKISIWKQGPFYPELGKNTIELPYQVNSGPSDLQIAIDGFTVEPDAEGNFLQGNYSKNELDAIHTYGIMRMVIDYYEKVLGVPVIWYWNKECYTSPLKVKINLSGIDARYSRSERAVILDKYGFEYNRIHNCRSVDLVAHETAHVILDSLRPEWEQGSPEVRGLAEAFCDFASMFWILSQRDMCSEVIAETNGDLRKSNMLSLFGVGHGFEELPRSAIRDASSTKKLMKENRNPYHFCEVITGLLYDILVDEYELHRMGKSDENVLYQVGNMWADAIVWAFVNCPENPTISFFLTSFLPKWSGSKDKLVRFLKKNFIS